MNKVEMKCLGALYGNGKPPSTEEVTLELEREQAIAQLGESERNHQMRLHRWLVQRHIPHYAPYNEGHAGEKEARGAKMMGMSPGICDLVVTMARKPHHGLYIELKAKPHGKVSGAQEWWLKMLLNEDYLAVVSWTFDDSIKIVQDYLVLPRWDS